MYYNAQKYKFKQEFQNWTNLHTKQQIHSDDPHCKEINMDINLCIHELKGKPSLTDYSEEEYIWEASRGQSINTHFFLQELTFCQPLICFHFEP